MKEIEEGILTWESPITETNKQVKGLKRKFDKEKLQKELKKVNQPITVE